MDDNIGLSRRQILAGLGAVGVASAGAGLGTTAYFSDEESFENNTLTAGELDLKVDWQQTYNGPIPGTDGGVGEHPVNAYPDTAVDGQSYGDGLQDLNGIRYSGAGEIDPVFDAADVPACCDCGEDEYYVTYGGESYCIEPLTGDDPQEAYQQIGVRSEQTDFQDESRSTVFLWEDEDDGDVYLFIVNDRIDTATGGTATYRVEGSPEARWVSSDWVVQDDDPSSDDSYEDPDSSDQVAVGNWIWNGENTDGGVIGPVNNNGTQGDFALRLTPELNQMAELHESNAGSYPGWFDDNNWAPLTRLTVLDGDTDNAITLEDGIDASGENVGQITIHSSCGIDSGAELEIPAVFRSENYPDQEHLVELDDVKPGDTGEITFSLHLCDNPGYVWFTAGNFSQDGGTLTEPEEAAMGDGESDGGELAEYIDVTLWYDDDCDNVYEEDETPIFEGSLADLMGELGIVEGADEESDDFSGMLQLDADPNDDGGVECFPAQEGFCVGFEWEVPIEVGNVIQGDSVGFDLGFYTEQCRHNDGSGPDN